MMRSPRFRLASRAFLRLLLTVLVLFSAAWSTFASANAFVRLPGHIPAAALRARVIGAIDPAEPVRLTIGLPLRHRKELQERLSRIYDPHDPLYHHFLKRGEFARLYDPTEADYRRLAAHLRSQGFAVVSTTTDREFLGVSGPASLVERAFLTRLARFRDADGTEFRAPLDEPSVPLSIAATVQGMVGLDDRLQLRPHLRMTEAVQSPHQIGSDPNTGALQPSDIKKAYNLSGVTQTGSGQVLGLYELDSYTTSDVTTWENAYGISNVTLQNVTVDGGPGGPGSGQDEVTLDIELQIALAPGVSKILVYEAPNGSGILDLWSRIASDDLAGVVSTSWGADEKDTTQAFAQLEATPFAKMATQGQTAVAAAGDTGAYDIPNNTTDLAVDDPASQLTVLGVGGTKLSVNSSGGTWKSETTWNESSSSAGGGGISTFWSIPSWQSGLATSSNKASSTMRNVPDVSLDADPNTGYAVYSRSGWRIYGGTSCASPLWAAFLTLVNQARVAKGFSTVGQVNSLLSTIAQGSSSSTCFHDVADSSTNRYYPAVTGYDCATGWGTFNGANLLSAMTGYKISGTITANGSGLSGVTVTAGSFSATTNASGAYTITGVPPGTYSVTPSLTGYTFLPTASIITLSGDVTGNDYTATGIYSITGKVTYNSGGLSGVTITAGSSTASTAADGTYTISSLGPGTYTVTAAKTGYAFSPSSKSVTLGPSSTGNDFTATGAYSISGTVTYGSNGLSGVTVTAGSLSATTASDGTYTVSGLIAGTYTVTPSLTGYTFSPTSTSVTVSANVSNKNFTATGSSTISGKITYGGSGLTGVTVTAGSFSATTGSGGTYTISAVTPGTYTVTPSLTGYVFSPTSQSVTVTPSASNINFTATGAYSISGKVTYGSSGLTGVTVTAGSFSTTTGSGGTYTISGVTPGTYTVIPSLTGYTFSPASQSVTVSPSATNVNFTAAGAYSISGTITYNGAGLAGVAVAAGSFSATTAGDGTYTLAAVTPGTYTVTPSLTGYTFSPSPQSVTVGPTKTGVNYTAAGAYTISGKVTYGSAGLAGVTVAAGSFSATTGGDGTYTISGVTPGSYTVTPTLTGYVFSATSTSVTVGPSAANVNFTAAGAYSISGKVTYNGAGLDGVSVAAGSFSAVTSGGGLYTIPAIIPGTYSVTPSLAGYVFSPTTSVTVGPSATGIDFTATGAYSISGKVTYGNAGLSGVTVAAGAFSTTTAADGTYSLSALPPGTYSITPALTGYLFSPGSTSVTVGPSASNVNFAATGAYSISGKVTYNNSGLAGVTVSAGSFSANTAADGTYTISGVLAGTYAVTPALPGYLFTPGSTSVTVGPSITNVNFTAAGAYTISGTISFGGSGLGGVTVTAGTFSATTQPDGTYTLASVTPGTYTVTPSLAGYAFTPPTRSVTVGPSASGIDFTASGAYTISGKVTYNGAGLAGATVTAGAYAATTAADGTYTINTVPAGTYTVTPTLSGYTFSPTATSVTIGPNASGINFTATGAYTISGQVTYGAAGLAGVTVAAGGFSATTAGDGTYTITALPPGTYNIIPALTGYVFSPDHTSITVGPSASNVNFAATGAYSIAGKVTYSGSGLGGVTVQAGAFSATTGGDGTYTISGVTAGTYTVTPALTGYTFSPATTSVTVGPSASNVNFTAAGIYSITGKVTYNGAALSGVTVATSGASAVTAADGTYTLAALPPGTYTVTPTRIGYAFTPPNASVGVGPSASGVDFTAAGIYTITGTVTAGGSGLGGVAIAAGSFSTTTAGDGTYTLSALPPGNYTVTPSLAGYGFTPTSKSVTIGPSAAGINFTGKQGFTVSGKVTYNGSGLAGVTVSNGATSATTAADGTYSLTGVGVGTYTITPARTGYTFSPATTSVTVGPNASGIDFASAGAYSISGKVAYGGNGLAGVTLTAGSFSAVSVSGGTYTISGLIPGNYTVTPALTGYTFTPATSSVTVGPSASNINFTATGAYSISGTVIRNGAGLGGVSISAGSTTTTTAADGTYSIGSLPPGSYTVSASRPGFVFSPSTQSVTLGPSATGVDFAAAGAFSIGGRITYRGNGVAGVSVAAGSQTATTGPDGSYTITGVSPGSYSVSPSLAGYAFSPNSASVSVGPNANNVNFTAAGTYTLRGTVRYHGNGQPGVAVAAGALSAVTGADGSYTLSAVPPGTLTVTPALTGYVFSPPSLTETLGPSVTGADFSSEGAYTIGGHVTFNGSGLPGVAVAAGPFSAITAADGSYTISAVTPGGYSVTASLAGYAFSPASPTVTVGPSASGVNFSAAGAYSISGRITTAAGPLAGVTVGSGAATAQTAADGTYTLSGLIPGQFTVTPSLAGLQFTPPNRTVTLGPSATGVAFAAALAPATGGKLSVSPAKLAFGTVKIYSAKTLKLTLKNTGTAAVQVLVGSVAAPFAVNGGGPLLTVVPRGKVTLSVTFNPVAKGATSGSLLLLSSDPAHTSVPIALTGTGK